MLPKILEKMVVSPGCKPGSRVMIKPNMSFPNPRMAQPVLKRSYIDKPAWGRKAREPLYVTTPLELNIARKNRYSCCNKGP